MKRGKPKIIAFTIFAGVAIFLLTIPFFHVQASNWWYIPFNGILSGLLAFIYWLYLFFVSWLDNYLIAVKVFEDRHGVFLVGVGWRILRDIVNLGYIGALIAIAFSTVFGQAKFAVKRMIPKLLISLILVNMSLLIVSTITTVGDLVMESFSSNEFLGTGPGIDFGQTPSEYWRDEGYYFQKQWAVGPLTAITVMLGLWKVNEALQHDDEAYNRSQTESRFMSCPAAQSQPQQGGTGATSCSEARSCKYWPNGHPGHRELGNGGVYVCDPRGSGGSYSQHSRNEAMQCGTQAEWEAGVTCCTCTMTGKWAGVDPDLDHKKVFMGLLFSLLLLIVFGIAVLRIAVLLLVRRVGIWLQAILAPTAFFGMAMPGVAGREQKWWKQFIELVFIGPAIMFFVYLTGIIATAFSTATANSSSGGVSGNEFLQNQYGDFQIFTAFGSGQIKGIIIAVVILYYGLGAVNKMRGEVGAGFDKFVNTVKKNPYVNRAKNWTKGKAWGQGWGDKAGLGKKALRYLPKLGRRGMDKVALRYGTDEQGKATTKWAARAMGRAKTKGAEFEKKQNLGAMGIDQKIDGTLHGATYERRRAWARELTKEAKAKDWKKFAEKAGYGTDGEELNDPEKRAKFRRYLASLGVDPSVIHKIDPRWAADGEKDKDKLLGKVRRQVGSMDAKDITKEMLENARDKGNDADDAGRQFRAILEGLHYGQLRDLHDDREKGSLIRDLIKKELEKPKSTGLSRQMIERLAVEQGQQYGIQPEEGEKVVVFDTRHGDNPVALTQKQLVDAVDETGGETEKFYVDSIEKDPSGRAKKMYEKEKKTRETTEQEKTDVKQKAQEKEQREKDLHAQQIAALKAQEETEKAKLEAIRKGHGGGPPAGTPTK